MPKSCNPARVPKFKLQGLLIEQVSKACNLQLDASHYLDMNSDVKIANVDPHFHFWHYGINELRKGCRLVKLAQEEKPLVCKSISAQNEFCRTLPDVVSIDEFGSSFLKSFLSLCASNQTFCYLDKSDFYSTNNCGLPASMIVSGNRAGESCVTL